MTNATVNTVSPKITYRAVKTSRLYEQIVQQVEESILKGQLKPGDQLPAERDLAQSFGVSRTAVREAVKALREKGLVEAYTGRGTFVTNGTSQSMRQSLNLITKINQADGSLHLAELRRILEPEIAALAAPRIDEQLLSHYAGSGRRHGCAACTTGRNTSKQISIFIWPWLRLPTTL